MHCLKKFVTMLTNALFEEVCHDVAMEPILQSVTNNNPSANTNNGD